MADYIIQHNLRIEDTYCEAFSGIAARILVTASENQERDSRNFQSSPLAFAALRATSTPATVIGRLEAGIESKGWIDEKNTPDNRKGVVLQFWGKHDDSRPLKTQKDKFYEELSYRIRQDILCTPTTRVFDWMPPELADGKIDMEFRVGRCGGGHEYAKEDYGRKMISIPLMAGYDFQIEREIGFSTSGIMGANFWIMGSSHETALEASLLSVKEIHSGAENVITPFYACPAGSGPEYYEPVGPATNIEYCPALKSKIKNSKVPDGISSIYEIVIDGLSQADVENAMKIGIESLEEFGNEILISAGNYGGKLGKHNIYLRDIG